MTLPNLAPWLYGTIGFLTPILTVLSSGVELTTRNLTVMGIGAIIGACSSLIKTFIEGDVVRTAARVAADKFNADRGDKGTSPSQ